MLTTTRFLVVLLTLPFLGCGGGGAAASGSTTPAPAAAPAGGTAAAADASQVDRGATLYVAQCAGCHGDQGQGKGKAPALVGDGVLSRFATAGDLLEWVGANMPKNAPGSLGDEQVAAIVAFALSANGIDMSDRVLDAQTASEIALR